VVALIFTALLGIAGYVVQSKNASDADRVQHEILQEAAAHERLSQKASKQLERVQQQNAELIQPAQALICQVFRTYERAIFDCGLEEYTAAYAMQWVCPPTQPYAEVLNIGSPEYTKRWATSPFALTLPPADVERLTADPTKQARWTNLVVRTLLPPLRELAPILVTKVRRVRWYARPTRIARLHHSRTRAAILVHILHVVY
jgi:hypothetical protein